MLDEITPVLLTYDPHAGHRQQRQHGSLAVAVRRRRLSASGQQAAYGCARVEAFCDSENKAPVTLPYGPHSSLGCMKWSRSDSP